MSGGSWGGVNEKTWGGNVEGVAAHVSADEVVPVLDDAPGCDADSANFLRRSGTVLLQSVAHVLRYTCGQGCNHHLPAITS